jgi:hypothetical protein
MENQYQLTPEEFQAMLDASIADQRIALQGQNFKRGSTDYSTPQPKGNNLGYTFVASNPLEHLAAAIQRTQGGIRMDRSQGEQERQLGAKGQGMGAFYGATQRNAPVPVDYGALYGEDPVSAADAANAMGGNVERQRGLGNVATTLGGPFEAAGKQYGMEALTGQRDLIGVGQHRAEMAGKRQALLQSAAQAEADRLWKEKSHADTLSLGRERLRFDMTKPAKEAKETSSKDAADLRKEFQGLATYKNTQGVAESAKKILSTGESGPGDVSMIFAFMKMVDPTSTVREGEFATAEQAGGVPARLVSTYNKLLTGERLSPDVRRQFKEEARTLLRAQVDRFEETAKPYRRLAESRGINPSDVVLDLGLQGLLDAQGPPAAAVAPSAPAGSVSAPSKRPTRIVDGVTKEWNGSAWVAPGGP